MLSARRLELARRKERLIARAEAERGELAALGGRLPGLGLVDRALAAAGAIARHRLLAAAALAAVLAFGALGGRRRVIGLLGRALAAWRAWRLLAGWFGKLRG